MHRLLLAALFLPTHLVVGQYSIQGLDLDGDIVSWYDQTLGDENATILEGSFCNLPNLNTDQNQFFQKSNWTMGEVCYRNQTYKGVQLLYNSYSDLLIIKNVALLYSVAQPTLLNQKSVSKFLIFGRQFVNLQGANTPSEGAGFYELLYSGKHIVFYAKRIKKEYIETGKLVYKEEDRFFIIQDDQFTRFTGRRVLYNMFSDYKTDLKAFSKGMDLRLKSEVGQRNLMLLLAYCDQLLTEK